MRNPKITAMVTYAIVTALMCIFGPMSVPIGPIPVSLTNLIIYFAIFIIGTQGTTIAFVVYLLLGIVGLPIFSGYQGGPAKIAGPTGGYLIGFIFMSIICGVVYNKFKGSKLDIPMTVLGMIIGTLVAYAFGTVWFVYQAKCELGYAISVCVIPFIPFDLGKIVIANLLGRAVRKPLVKQGLIK